MNLQYDKDLVNDLLRIKTLLWNNRDQQEHNPKATPEDKAFTRGEYAGFCEALELVFKHQPMPDL